VLAEYITRVQLNDSLVSMRAVHPLIQAVVASGVPRDTFLRAASLDPSCDQASDQRLPQTKLFQLFELALELTGDPAFGLHSTERLTSEAVNPLGSLLLHAATLRDALQSLQEFRTLFGNQSTFRIQERDTKVHVRCHSHPEASPRARRYLCEVSLGGLYMLLRRFAVTSVDYVAFEYPAPDYYADYLRVFDGRARFEQPFTGLCFDAAQLATPSPHVDPELHESLSAYARRRVQRMKLGQSWAARVHEVLVWQRPPRDMSMKFVARRLGVSTRTLRRQLVSEHKSYAELVSAAQGVIAKSYLSDERRSIMDTAHELGFSDNTAFHRAFKRWTGLTPGEYRRKRAGA
jgi:AraC-like DNA-binding protein